LIFGTHFRYFFEISAELSGLTFVGMSEASLEEVGHIGLSEASQEEVVVYSKFERNKNSTHQNQKS